MCTLSLQLSSAQRQNCLLFGFFFSSTGQPLDRVRSFFRRSLFILEKETFTSLAGGHPLFLTLSPSSPSAFQPPPNPPPPPPPNPFLLFLSQNCWLHDTAICRVNSMLLFNGNQDVGFMKRKLTGCQAEPRVSDYSLM